MLYDLIILGGGPAGVAAGIYAARKKIKFLLLTQYFGGQSVNSASIENFIGFKSISGIELAKNLEEHLRAQSEAEIKDGVTVVSIKKNEDVFEITDSSGEIYKSKTILYTLGSGYKKLNIPGEKEYEGKGVFYCSICDAPLMKEKDVVVIGGGNSGLEAVRDLIPYASKITILEFSDNPKGDPSTYEKIMSSGKVSLITSAKIEKIFGDKFVNKIEYQDLKNGEKKEINVSGVFIAVGWKPNSGLIKDFVKIDKYEHIIVDHKTFQTSCSGLWAAGDVTDSLYAQINPAIGDGVKAILNIYDYLQNKQS
ncbi:MAG TPA: FAD-dependent oxidoreductase [Candidatus Paceibacterota bacterium]|nr:FAD-dependent oxidoreductase [Candidatus Paceibacterota bacterium]